MQSSHLALIDTLMMAYTVEMVSVERVMSCINRYSTAEPSNGDGHIQELPYDTEDTITTWINKVLVCTNTGRCCLHELNEALSRLPRWLFIVSLYLLCVLWI